MTHNSTNIRSIAWPSSAALELPFATFAVQGDLGFWTNEGSKKIVPLLPVKTIQVKDYYDIIRNRAVEITGSVLVK
ncbi:MAG: hypothetical protein GXX09_02020 [Syntrophomonadaceae bacterium]|nr:hypothetical protein [Syntrophomonadaceae bacterium]